MAETAATSPAVGDEITPYKIHVPSKYLDLTTKKLELTRLPHENPGPKAEDWWEPKPQVEALIDFWLEKYSWRDHEANFNALPQFRTAISLESAQAPLRIHFLHYQSPRADAVPLLLIPPFPLTNLLLAHLSGSLVDPPADDTGAQAQAFHLVIPSLPGLGFSDALPNNAPAVPTTAEMLDTLMRRLGYPHYRCSQPQYCASCLGVHIISPALVPPKLATAPVDFLKWLLASFFTAAILGYTAADFTALSSSRSRRNRNKSSNKSSTSVAKQQRQTGPGLNALNLHEPNTLSYALCDTPTGLLVFVLKILTLLAMSPPPPPPPIDPNHPEVKVKAAAAAGEKTTAAAVEVSAATAAAAAAAAGAEEAPGFTSEQVITVANLAWAPGPQYALRFWAHCAMHGEAEAAEARRTRAKGVKKPCVALTVFVGGGSQYPKVAAAAAGKKQGAAAGEDTGTAKLSDLLLSSQGSNSDAATTNEPYVCPAWGNARYEVVFMQRESGRAGLLAWERPEIIASGVRGLAEAVMQADKRLARGKGAEAAVTTAPLEKVTVVKDDEEEKDKDKDKGKSSTGPQKQPTTMTPAVTATVVPTVVISELAATEPSSKVMETVKEEKEEEEAAAEKKDKGKGKEVAGPAITPVAATTAAPAPTATATSAPSVAAAEAASPIPTPGSSEALQPPPAHRDVFSSDDESPDTLVVSTPPLGGTPPVASPVPR